MRVLLIAMSIVVAATVNCQPRKHPNIIVMYSDDHTAQAVGAYRGALNYGLRLDHSPTPHIDRLAKEGMRFDNAFATNAICQPSRAVLLTGMHSHKNGVTANGKELSMDMETFPMLLQQAGYQTAIIGKWHLGTEPQGFDYFEILQGQGPYYNPTMWTTNGDVERQGHTTEIITESTLRWLREDRDPNQPFMLIYNHKAPHRDWLPEPKHLNDYRDRDLPEPSTLFYDHAGFSTAAKEQDMEIATTMDWGWDLKVPLNPETGEPNPGWQRLLKANNVTVAQRRVIEAAYENENRYLYEHYHQMTAVERIRWKYQRYIKDYLRVVKGVDDGVGEVMAYLEHEGVLDNTIIIYAGDQGFFLGEKGWFDKRWIYEESMRMPLIVHWPEGIKPGSVDKHLVQNLDLAPTILELAGLGIPNYMQGLSMFPLLKGRQSTAWRDAVYYQYYEGSQGAHRVARHYGVRTERYTLAHFPDYDEWELFDLDSDPEQLDNVYGKPAFGNIQQQLKNRINELQKLYEDDTWQ